MKSTIYEVLDYGPISAGDSELGILITVNGSYLNCWVGSQEGGWNCTDCRFISSENGLYSISAADAWDKAKDYLADILKGDEEEESNDD